MNQMRTVSRMRSYFVRGDKIEKHVADCTANLTELKTAIEGSMDIAVINIMTSILQSLDKAGDKARAYLKCDVAAIISFALEEMGSNAAVCERCMLMIAYLCRSNDGEKVKANMSLEVIKSFATAGMCSKMVTALLKYPEDPKVVVAVCDALRGMCMLDSNRSLLGAAGICEPLGRALHKFLGNIDVTMWICRAIGHLSLNNDDNREAFSGVGTIAIIVELLTNNMTNVVLGTEICWAIRNVAPIESSRAHLANEKFPELVIGCFKNHISSEMFMTEACRALVACLANEEDDLIPRIENANAVPLTLKALKKNIESESLSRWVINLMYYIAAFETDDMKGGRKQPLVPRLINCDILDTLSIVFEKHAHDEALAEWGCRTVHKIAALGGSTSGKMRNAGLNEMVVSCVQRQAISQVVSGFGSLAIGDLAMDTDNHSRLATAGACEAVCAALKRHDESHEVVEQICHAVHYLAATPNNVELMRVSEGCEAVTHALGKHTPTSLEATRGAVRALGSLAKGDESSLQRFLTAGACGTVVTALKTYPQDKYVSEYACRAIYYLCHENQCVSELGKKDACKFVLIVLQAHAEEPLVTIQCLLAISGLAVKAKNEKVHKGNTKKLVSKGAIECVVTSLRKYPSDENVQKAGAMAMASLAKLDENRNKFIAAGSCQLVIAALSTHAKVEKVVAKMALAVEALAQGAASESREIFSNKAIVDTLIKNMFIHERSPVAVADTLRALVTLTIHEGMRGQIRKEENIRSYVRVMRLHEKVENVAKWGCNLIVVSSDDDPTRAKLGGNKACEAVVAVLSRHAAKSEAVAELGCRAIVVLFAFHENKLRLNTSDACSAVVLALKSHTENPMVSEWAASAIVALAGQEANRSRLGSAGAPAALTTVLKNIMSSEIVVKLACEAIHELSKDDRNRQVLGTVGACEVLALALQTHVANALVAVYVCRSIAGVSNGSIPNATKLGNAGVNELLPTVLKSHPFVLACVEWACAATASMADRNVPNQSDMGNAGMCSVLVAALETNKGNAGICLQASRALRALCMANVDNTSHASLAGVVPISLKVLRNHREIDGIVESLCWLIGNVVVPEEPSGDVVGGDATTASGTAPAAAVTATPTPVGISTVSMPNTRALYSLPSNWDLLVTTLETHMAKDLPCRWICAAIATFADHSNVTHIPACDALLSAVAKHIDKGATLQKILVAVGTLADAHPENQQRMGRFACNFVDQLLPRAYENEIMAFGLLRCIAGLAQSNLENQKRFYAFPTFNKTVVKILYDMYADNEMVARWGCAAIASLAHKMPGNQKMLGLAGEYLGDIIEAHKSSPEVVREAFRAISLLAHGNIANRNRLGSAEACDVVSQALTMYSEPFDSAELVSWGVRAIADLAANNPNNQSRLGIKGSCEALVKVITTRISDPKLVKWTCWAIGNMIQLGKGAAMVIEEGTSSSVMKNTTRFGNAGVAEAIVAVLKKHKEDVDVVIWASRAINNMAKSRSLKGKLLKAGASVAINAVNSKYSQNKEVSDWTKLVKETLEAVMPMQAPASPDNSAKISPFRKSTGHSQGNVAASVKANVSAGNSPVPTSEASTFGEVIGGTGKSSSSAGAGAGAGVSGTAAKRPSGGVAAVGAGATSSSNGVAKKTTSSPQSAAAPATTSTSSASTATAPSATSATTSTPNPFISTP